MLKRHEPDTERQEHTISLTHGIWKSGAIKVESRTVATAGDWEGRDCERLHGAHKVTARRL